MPCYDPPLTEAEVAQLKRQEEMRDVYKLRNLEIKVSQLTNMLCTTCRQLEKIKPEVLTHEFLDIGNWYYQHKYFDDAREERERQQKEQQLLYKKRQIEELQKEIEELQK